MNIANDTMHCIIQYVFCFYFPYINIKKIKNVYILFITQVILISINSKCIIFFKLKNISMFYVTMVHQKTAAGFIVNKFRITLYIFLFLSIYTFLSVCKIYFFFKSIEVFICPGWEIESIKQLFSIFFIEMIDIKQPSNFRYTLQ